MTADFLPLRLLLLTLAGWVNRHQQHVIVKGQRFGRQVLRQVATIVTPDTILRWYRRLIAATFTLLRPGCPRNRGLSRSGRHSRPFERDRGKHVRLPNPVEESNLCFRNAKHDFRLRRGIQWIYGAE
jgi:hypothetical protein